MTDENNDVWRLHCVRKLAADALKSELLASLPTYDQAISMLMAVMKAPVEKMARTMNEVPGKLTRTMAALRDQKQ